MSNLPTELVLRTLELALLSSQFESESTFMAIGLGQTAQPNYDFLRQASLVCRQWRGAAQGLLFKTAYVSTKARAAALLASGKLGSVRHLIMLGKLPVESKITADIASDLIRGATGVQSLCVEKIAQLRASTLFHPSMTNCRRLTILTDILDAPARKPAPASPFTNLTHLCMPRMLKIPPPVFLGITTSSQSTITHLDIRIDDKNVGGAAPAFAAVAGSIASLRYAAHNLPSFHHHLAQCNSLVHLDTDWPSQLLLYTAFLPVEIKTLSLWGGSRRDMKKFETESLLEALKTKAMKSLETITIRTAEFAAQLTANPFPIPRAVVDECKARGIVIKAEPGRSLGLKQKRQQTAA
ncbi:hypothetical protein RQP46_003924 [Phenoliferia psychrophenolica]